MKTLLIIAALSLSGCTAADLAAFNAGYYGTGLQQPRPQTVYQFYSQPTQSRPLPEHSVRTRIIDTPSGMMNCTEMGGTVLCY